MSQAKKSALHRAENPVTQAITAYKDAIAELDEFCAKHHKLVKDYQELVGRKNTMFEELKEIAKREVRKTFKLKPDYAPGGVYKRFETGGIAVELQDSTPREVDVQKLLKMMPKAADWPGLLTVSVRQFDSLTSTGVLSPEAAKGLLKPPTPDRVWRATVILPSPKDDEE